LASGYRAYEMQRVLVVDDFEPFRQFVCSHLQDAPNFAVIDQAADGFEAVRKAEQHQPDVILLDVGLPGLNGVEAGRRISHVAPRSKILYLSQNSDPDIVHSAISNGARGYVFKSSAARELLRALEAVMRGERFVSPELVPPLI
jgi:DNA-binding NarL/FixJ family response regulator